MLKLILTSLLHLVLLFPLLQSHPLFLSSPLLRQSTGLAGETCITTADCKSTLCIRDQDLECFGNQFNCFCAPTICDNKTECFPGENCNGTSKKICLSPNARNVQRQGNFTLGPCRNQQHCATGRDCYSIDAFAENIVQLCAPNVTTCACFPLNMETCTTVGSNEECVNGEICQEFSSTAKACLAPDFVQLPSMKADKQMGNLIQGENNGLTFDRCEHNIDCAGGRECLVPTSQQLKQCDGDKKCICVPLKINACKKAQDCVIEGENCLIVKDMSVCASKKLEIEIEDGNEMRSLIEGTVDIRRPQSLSSENDENEETKDDNGGICIAMKELRHLDRDDLVFKKDQHAHVLCDVFGSCATAGHIVEFDGVTMMMRSYCDIVKEGCERWRMKVNSPKLKWKRRIRSRSPRLEYTALAARYETNVEERILRVVSRFGL